MQFSTLCSPGVLALVGGNTFRNATRRPALYALLLLFGGLIVISGFITFFGFGQEINMIREMGISSIRLCGIFLAIFVGSGLIREERERGTLMTLLSKPVGRGAVILGKYLGILIVLFTATVVLSGIMAGTVYLAEGAVEPNLFQGIYLAMIEVAVIAAFSLFLSTFCPVFLNGLFCFFLFGLGHLSSHLYLVLRSSGGGRRLLGEVLLVAVPNLHNLDVTPALGAGGSISFSYLLGASGSAMGYILFFVLLAVLIFQGQEIGGPS
jgi:ABC-type transport system involved in multi-copper enzyme maturation permease subunit